MNKRTATLLDVARRAGVSRATAARALGGYSSVREETRQRISDAARDLGYQANELARAMRSGRTRTVGVVVSDISNAFFGAAVRTIADEAAISGYQTLLTNTNEDPASELRAIGVFLEKRVDGLLVVPASPIRFARFIEENPPEIPIVLLDRAVAHLNIASVVTDDRASAREAVGSLIALGHRKIALLIATSAVETFSRDVPDSMVSTVSERLEGALDACQAAGLPRADIDIVFCRSRIPLAAEAAHDILRRKPTALLATNEEMALGTVAACRDLGVSLPGDLSLISFDDAFWTSVFDPRISVIRRPVRELARSAIRLLLEEVEHGQISSSLMLKNTLLLRDSVAAPAIRDHGI